MNTVLTDTGTEVYLTEIHRLADEFTADMDAEQAQQPQVFTGLLNYIYRNVFKPSKHNADVFERNRYQTQTRSILDYSDIETLDGIWNIYLDLCIEYQQIPSLLDFSILTGIPNDEFTRWMNGTVRGKTDTHCRTVKNWKETCETALAKRAVMSNSIGAIFALKACHSWRETAPITTEPEQISVTHSTPEQIAERYADAKRPTLPDFTCE